MMKRREPCDRSPSVCCGGAAVSASSHPHTLLFICCYFSPATSLPLSFSLSSIRPLHHPLRSDTSTFSPPWDCHSSRFALFNLPKFSISPWFSPRAPIYRLVMFPPAFISPLLSDPAAYLHVGGIRRPLISSSDLISLMITVISEVIREDHDG